MKKPLSFFGAFSIRKKMYLIILLSIALLLIFFSVVFNIMMDELQDAIESKSTQTLSLICADLNNSSDIMRNVASLVMYDDSVKDYISGEDPAAKTTLRSRMSRTLLKSFDIPSNSGCTGIMVIRAKDDYICSYSSRLLTRTTYDKLASYVCENYRAGQNSSYLALPRDLREDLQSLCYVLPLNDDSAARLQIGGYLVVFMSSYNIMETLARYYSADTSFTVLDDLDNVIYRSGSALNPRELSEEPLSSAGRMVVRTDGEKDLVLYRKLANSGWLVSLQTPMATVSGQLAKYRAMFALTVLLIVAVSFLLITSFSRSITHRLTEMTDVINTIREGDIDARFPVVYQDEISLIGSEFNRMIDQIQNFHLNAAMQELRQKEAELHALQSNINPHFLYNSLDCIRSCALVSGDQRVARQVQLLSNMFRYTVGNSFRSEVTVEDELNHVYDYLAMLSFRFEDRYFVDIDIPEKLFRCRTLKLVFQPLVENAFSHGVRHMAQGGHVRISGGMDEAQSFVWLRVEDNGAGIPPERLEELQDLLAAPAADRDSPFMALLNTNDRIRIAYGQEYGVSIESVLNRGTTATLRFPIIYDQGVQIQC